MRSDAKLIPINRLPYLTLYFKGLPAKVYLHTPSALALISIAVRASGGISIPSLVCISGALRLAEARRSSLDTALLLLLLPSALLAKDDVAVPHLGLRVPLLQAERFFTAQTPSFVGRCSWEPRAGAVGGGVAGTRGLSSVREQTGAQRLR